MNKDKNSFFEKFIINDESQFDKLLDFIHDELIYLSQIRYNSNNKILEFRIYRRYHEGPKRKIKDFIIYKEWEVDIIEAKLQIENVNDYKVKDPDKIASYTINNLEYNKEKKILYIHCDPNLEIEISVTDLHINFRDIRFKGKHIIKFLFPFIEF